MEVFLQVLQANARTLTSNNLSDEIEKLHITPMHVSLSQQNDGVSDSSSSNTYSDDIEVEANSYFQRMFSEQLTIDEMVQMLSRFKESSEKRFSSIIKAFRMFLVVAHESLNFPQNNVCFR